MKSIQVQKPKYNKNHKCKTPHKKKKKNHKFKFHIAKQEKHKIQMQFPKYSQVIFSSKNRSFTSPIYIDFNANLYYTDS